MPSSELAFSFREMVATQEAKLTKWEQWFLKQPESLLDLSLDLA